MPERIQLKRVKGWRMPANTVSVARPGIWGNPFFISKWRDTATCLALFEDAVLGVWNPATSAHLPHAWCGYDEYVDWMARMQDAGGHPMELVRQLRGKNLACWCGLDQPCHADVLLRAANS